MNNFKDKDINKYEFNRNNTDSLEMGMHKTKINPINRQEEMFLENVDILTNITSKLMLDNKKYLLAISDYRSRYARLLAEYRSINKSSPESGVFVKHLEGLNSKSEIMKDVKTYLVQKDREIKELTSETLTLKQTIAESYDYQNMDFIDELKEKEKVIDNLASKYTSLEQAYEIINAKYVELMEKFLDNMQENKTNLMIKDLEIKSLKGIIAKLTDNEQVVKNTWEETARNIEQLVVDLGDYNIDVMDINKRLSYELDLKTYEEERDALKEKFSGVKIEGGMDLVEKATQPFVGSLDWGDIDIEEVTLIKDEDNYNPIKDNTPEPMEPQEEPPTKPQEPETKPQEEPPTKPQEPETKPQEPDTKPQEPQEPQEKPPTNDKDNEIMVKEEDLPEEDEMDLDRLEEIDFDGLDLEEIDEHEDIDDVDETESTDETEDIDELEEEIPLSMNKILNEFEDMNKSLNSIDKDLIKETAEEEEPEFITEDEENKEPYLDEIDEMIGEMEIESESEYVSLKDTLNSYKNLSEQIKSDDRSTSTIEEEDEDITWEDIKADFNKKYSTQTNEDLNE